MFMGGALLLSGAAFAQTTTQAMQSCPAPTYSGVYHLATGTFTKASLVGTTQNAGVGGVVYHNTCPLGFYYNISDGSTLIDEGQILSTGSGGSQDSYTINSFNISYCTSADDPAIGGPGTRIIVSIIQDYDPCGDLASSEAPLVTFDLTGLPGSDPAGFSCHTVTIDLTGMEFCINGDADGTYGGDPTLDNFGYTFTFPDAAGNNAGPLMAGGPACATGDGTAWQNPGNDGSGAGNQNLFVIDGGGCYWFGGNPFAGFYLSLNSDLAGACAGGGCASNDDCACATDIAGDGSFAFDTSGATTGAEGQANAACNFFGQTSMNDDVWFSWTAGSSGDATITLCNASGDTKLAVYDGDVCPTAEPIACNDDSCGLLSEVLVPVTAGNVYYIQVANFSAGGGANGNLDISTAGGGCTTDDDCDCATAISGDGSFAFDTSNHTTSANQDCTSIGLDKWYRWTAGSDGDVTFDLCGSSFDTKLALHADGSCGGGGCIGSNDDSCGLQSSVTLNGVLSGDTVRVQVGGYGTNSGTGTLNINTAGGCSAPGNDDCATPDAIAGDGSFAFDTVCATNGAEGQANAACDFFGQPDMNDDVWFAWTAGVTGDAVVSLCANSGDTKLAVYDGAVCPTAEPIACNDDSCGLLSEVLVPVTAGNVYGIQVANFSSGGGANGVLDINTSVSGPANDECTAAEVVGDGTYPFDSTFATTGAEGQANAECDFFGTTAIENDLWYEYTSAVNGILVATVCSQTGVDTKMAMYDGAGCPTGAPIACNDDDCGLQSTVYGNVVAGQTYTLQLGTFPGSSGGAGTVTFFAQDLGLGQNYCYSTPNSTGYPAIIASAGSDVVADNNLSLAAGPAPIGETGIFFYGQNQNSVPLGNGIRCIGPGNFRVMPPVQVLDNGSGTGFMSTMVDLANPPAVAGTITVGSTWNFQAWFRDSAVGSTDLSDAQEISFL
jgi:hypothetical protein